jgi:outer membrane PBP1 activator LpoA protein
MKLIHSKITLALFLATALGACQTTTVSNSVSEKPKTVPEAADEATLTPQEEQFLAAFQLESEESWNQAAEAYRNLAEDSTQPDRSNNYINAALMYYRARRYGFIEPFFETLDEGDILPVDKNYRAIILSGTYFGNGKIYQSLLALPDIEDITDYRFKALALNIRSKGVLAIGKPLESVKLRIQIDEFLKTVNEKEKNHDFIWDALNHISEPAILRTLNKQQTSELRGWLELNLIARRSNMLPAKIEPWINQWYQIYDGHAAGAYFAVNLLEESRRIYIKPTRITLMLPYSGRLEKVSEAIQNGFLYAYYQDQELGAELEIINASSDVTEFGFQYQQAIEDGAEFIVGPINKDLVNLLQNKDKLAVPTLALNYAEDKEDTTLNLYQFGLRPEDEAEQIADLALAEGRNHAITLVPDTEWGSRLQLAFSERFENLGGRVVSSEIYRSKKNDHSTSIKQLLNLTTSNQRRSIIQQVIGEPVKFEPRRRQDVDMVFIAANSRQARLIKPQLKFHHAQNLPVYATSHISSSAGNPDDDRDLDGIQFVDIPWMLDNSDNQDFKQIGHYWPDSSKRFSRLYALGIDAYRLIPALRRLMINPGETVLSNTGQLSVDKNGRIRRTLLMATYNKGVTRLLEQPGNKFKVPANELQ